MSIALLYCEGAAKSPDFVVIEAILAGLLIAKKAVGTKAGLEKRILGVRDVQPNAAALRDRDFDTDESVPINCPREWSVKVDKTMQQIGWTWERKEIENYLIDPQVVQRSLNSKAPKSDLYLNALEASAKKIADYTAARIALSISRIQPLPIKNIWGKRRGKYRYAFPNDLDEVSCRTNISEIVQQYATAQSVEESEVLSKFDRLLPACRPGGTRFQYFLTFFSGKDLLYAMKDELVQFGFQSPTDFHDRVLYGITESVQDVWEWLPEWQRLRELIQSSNF